MALVFDHVSIRPGPRLNLVLGVNGSGKSTIVSAICIGLGGKFELLARGTCLKDFIQKGKDQFKITIELVVHDKNALSPRASKTVATIIKYYSLREEYFLLNGEKVSQKKITEFVKEHGIYLDNITTFLPQDRVSSFAASNNRAIFEKTMQSIGEDRLARDFDRLKSQKDTLIGLHVQRQDIKKKLDSEVKAIEKLRPDIQRLRTYTRAERKLKRIEHKLTLLERQDLEKNRAAQQDELKKKKADLNELKRETDISKLDHLKREIDTLQPRLRSIARSQEDGAKKIEHVRNDIATATSDLDLIEQNNKKYKSDIEVAQTTLQQLDKELNIQNTILESSSLKDDEAKAKIAIRDLDLKESNLNARASRIDSEINHYSPEYRDLRNQVARIDSELQQLNSGQQSKMRFLERADFDAFRAVRWLESSGRTVCFQGFIHPPIFMQISVKDPRNILVVENAISHSYKVCFLAENVHDLQLFVEETREKNKMKVNVFTTVPQDTISNLAHQIQNRVSINQLRQFGVYSYLDDLIDAPDVIKNFLRREQNIHNILVGDDSTEDFTEAVFRHTNVRCIYTPTKRYTRKISAYERGAEIKLMTPLNPLRENTSYFSQGSKHVEIQAQEKLREEAIGNLGALKAKLDSLSRDKIKIEEEIKDIKSSKKTHQEAIYESANVRDKKEAITSKMATQRLIIVNRNEKLDGIKHHIDKNLRKKCDRLTALPPLLRDVFDKQVEYNHTAFKVYQLEHVYQNINMNKARFQTQLSHLANEILSIETNIGMTNTAIKNLDKAIAKYKKEDTEVDSALSELPSEISALTDLRGECEGVLRETYIAKRDLVEELEAREARKEEYLHLLESLEANVSSNDNNFAEMLSKWKNEMEAIIARINSKFTAFFGLLNMQGYIELNVSDNDVKNYGIDIFVSFRHNERPTLLDTSRHSGGEKSLSTALYLMSLFQFGKSPFKVVDEINQGLDDPNERKLFSIISSEVASPTMPDGQTESFGQCFYISPKVVNDLEFKKGTTLLCVFKGNLHHSSLNSQALT